MDYGPILKDAQASHDIVKEILIHVFEAASEEDRAAFQDDVRRILLPYDLAIGLELLSEAVLSPKDRRGHIHFLFKYGTFAYDIIHFAESYVEKSGIDFPVDEKGLRNLKGGDAENFIVALQTPINNLFAPVLEFLRKYPWADEHEAEYRRLDRAVLKIGEAFLSTGKSQEEEESARVRSALRATVLHPLKK